MRLQIPAWHAALIGLAAIAFGVVWLRWPDRLLAILLLSRERADRLLHGGRGSRRRHWWRLLRWQSVLLWLAFGSLLLLAALIDVASS